MPSRAADRTAAIAEDLSAAAPINDMSTLDLTLSRDPVRTIARDSVDALLDLFRSFPITAETNTMGAEAERVRAALASRNTPTGAITRPAAARALPGH